VTDFALDARLDGDSIEITRLPLCLVRLMDDGRFPWVILVPARPGLREIVDLGVADRASLIEEVALVSTVMRDVFRPTKLNVGALGNVVSQLHVHVVARFASDDAWPGPVWGTTAERYRPEDLERTLALLREPLSAARADDASIVSR
jgi:diadenosine tetraphosphate (Ap4A) HIT family hydrolase